MDTTKSEPLFVPVGGLQAATLGLGFEVPGQPSIEEANDWVIAHADPLESPPTPVIRHTSAADEQAFDKLYEALREARDIVQRGIREGERGHKKALHDAMKILNEVT